MQAAHQGESKAWDWGWLSRRLPSEPWRRYFLPYFLFFTQIFTTLLRWTWILPVTKCIICSGHRLVLMDEARFKLGSSAVKKKKLIHWTSSIAWRCVPKSTQMGLVLRAESSCFTLTQTHEKGPWTQVINRLSWNKVEIGVYPLTLAPLVLSLSYYSSHNYEVWVWWLT